MPPGRPIATATAAAANNGSPYAGPEGGVAFPHKIKVDVDLLNCSGADQDRSAEWLRTHPA